MIWSKALDIGKWLLKKALGVTEKALDVDLEKYKVDGQISEKAIDASVEIDKLRAQQNIQDLSSWPTRLIRPLFAGVVIYYFAAIVAVSVHFHDHTVHRLPAEIEEWCLLILTAYFGGRSVEKVADAIFSKKR